MVPVRTWKTLEGSLCNPLKNDKPVTAGSKKDHLWSGRAQSEFLACFIGTNFTTGPFVLSVFIQPK